MQEIITDNLDLWTSALLTNSTTGRNGNGKQEAYGIKKLRELILELAVRGKLVPQDRNDEPASVLLETIAKAKARLIKDGKIKKEKPLLEITEEEKDYELPAGWVYVRLGDVAFSQAGFAFKSNFFNENAEGLPLIRIRDVGQPFTGTFYSGEYREEFLVEKEDYLVSMDGEFRVSPWTNGKALLNQRVSRLIFFDESVGQRFIADSLQARLRELQGVKAYTTVDHLSGTQISESVIGLPPLAEQHRIVAKIDELMALCDQLEQQQTRSIEAHQNLVETLLGTLTRVESQQELSEAWTRIANHFDILFATEHSIDQLKQTILQLAVMGRLVPQDPDEPASVLLKSIAEKKVRLIKEGAIKEQKSLPVIDSDEEPFPLREGWKWERLGAIATFENGDRSSKYPNSSDLNDTGIPFFGAQDMVEGTLRFDSGLRFISEAKFNELSNGKLIDKDIVMLLRGTVGKMATFRDSPEHKTGFINAQMLIIRLFDKTICEFFNLYSSSNFFDSQVEAKTTGTAVRQMPSGVVAEFLIPVPPFAEQQRIVAKVNEVMTLCDALKTGLGDAQTTQIRLADTIVEKAVA